MNISEQLEKIKNSKHLHKDWYRSTYPEVKAQGLDPAEHYLSEGAQKGYNPGKFFDTRLYVSRYPDVAASGLNPLVHYEVIGAAEDRIFNPAKAEKADQQARKAAASARREEGATIQKSAVDAARKAAVDAARKAAADAGRKAAQEEMRKLRAELKPATAAPPQSPGQSTALDKLSAKARAAAKKGDWLEASRHWQHALALPAEPYVGLSQAAAAMGDLARAEAILNDGLARFDANPMLLEAWCRLALKAKRWSEVARRWEIIERSGCLVDPKLQIAAAEAFLQIGETARAEALLEDLRAAHATDLNFKRISALLAEARQDWETAADIWMTRGAKATGIAKTNSYLRAVRARVAAGDLDRAEDDAQTLVRKFPREITYLKLHAEVAIAQDAWAVALERWQKVEAIDPAESGAMPPDWVYRIGVENARARTEAIRIGRLRATGMLTLATTIQSVDESGALVFARRARKFYPETVRAMVASLLSANTRHSAAIWWVRRLLATSETPQRYYPTLVESLLQSSRLEECEAVLDDYTASRSKDNLWLRAMIEIHYRRNDFAAMHAVMQAAVTKKLPIRFKSLRITRWIYDMIRLHPTPQTFLPAEIHDLLLRIATLYDGKFLSDSIGMLLNPAQGDAAARDYAAQIAQAVEASTEDAGAEMDPILQEEMLQFFMRRRDWDQVEALLALPLPSELTAANVKKVWNIVRNKIDIKLGQADVAGAEEVAVSFLEQLAGQELDGFAMSLTTGLLFRLPLSGTVASRLHACAGRLGFDEVAVRIADWQRRYVGFDPAGISGNAGRTRCFIVGNAPSIADLPLGALAGEDIFCVNRGMRARDVGLPLPKYLLVVDPHVYKSHAQEIDDDGALVEKFFVASNCLWRKPPTVPAIPLGASGLKLSLAPFRFAPLHFHRGETVVVLAAQLAIQMGYREIYIIGVDLDYSGPVTHFYGGGRKETERLMNFRPGGSGTDMVNLSFANLQKVVEPDGCRLYNAALGGKLDSLERVNFYDVLGVPRPEDSGSNNDTEEREDQ